MDKFDELNIDQLREIEKSVQSAIKSRLSEVDRTQVVLSDGTPVTPNHRKLKENGQQAGYVVLNDSERAKGFVRPIRRTYKHLLCGTTTTMGQAIAETYARDPQFYSGTFCCQCQAHFPLKLDGISQFVWIDDGLPVGS